MIILRCNICHERLTSSVKQLTDIGKYYHIQNNDYFKSGQYFEDDKSNTLILNISDCQGLIGHSDSNRFIGCCGPSPEGKLNQVCINCKAEIGRKTTDCLTPHYTRIDLSRVEKENDEHGFFQLLCHPYSIQLGKKLEDIESLYFYSNKSDAFKILKNELLNLKDNVPSDISRILGV